jgi:hypothetical protein
VCRGEAPEPLAVIDGKSYLWCARCEATLLAATDLPDAAEEVAQDQLHRKYAADPAYRGFVGRLAKPLLAFLRPGDHGLDYGCGWGPAGTALLCDAGMTMTLFDPLFGHDEAALTRRYDFIFCCEVAEHFHMPAEEFDRLDTLLEPGGWLAIITGFAPPGRDAAHWHFRRDPSQVVFYRKASFARIASDRSWRPVFPAPNVALLRKPRRIRRDGRGRSD